MFLLSIKDINFETYRYFGWCW